MERARVASTPVGCLPRHVSFSRDAVRESGLRLLFSGFESSRPESAASDGRSVAQWRHTTADCIADSAPRHVQMRNHFAAVHDACVRARASAAQTGNCSGGIVCSLAIDHTSAGNAVVAVCDDRGLR
jgi:hypothetical protein